MAAKRKLHVTTPAPSPDIRPPSLVRLHDHLCFKSTLYNNHGHPSSLPTSCLQIGRKKKIGAGCASLLCSPRPLLLPNIARSLLHILGMNRNCTNFIRLYNRRNLYLSLSLSYAHTHTHTRTLSLSLSIHIYVSISGSLSIYPFISLSSHHYVINMLKRTPIHSLFSNIRVSQW